MDRHFSPTADQSIPNGYTQQHPDMGTSGSTHNPRLANHLFSGSMKCSNNFHGCPLHVSPGTTQRERKPRGRPPASTTTTKVRPKQGHRGGIRKRGRARGRPPNKVPIPFQQTASSTFDSDVSDPSGHVTTDREESAPLISLRYGLRRDRAPRYPFGTCGLRDCTCNILTKLDDQLKPRGVLVVDETTKSSLVIRLVIRAKKTYTGV